MDSRKINLQRLNSATKYPSILTLHKLGEKGRLTADLNLVPEADLVVTEKVDGTNTRIIFMPDGVYMIGSREHLLHAKGDLIHNPALGIVDSVRHIAERVNRELVQDGLIRILFLETYGGKTTAAAKDYTSNQSFGHRAFDLITLNDDILSGSTAEIASWRENGGQNFADEDTLKVFANTHDITLTERLDAPDLPTDHGDVLRWLETNIPHTFAALDDGARKGAEGVVVRTADRTKIAKIRYSDYRRTLKIRK